MVALLAASFGGCSNSGEDGPETGADGAAPGQAVPTPAARPKPLDLSASHIVIMHVESEQAPDTITRTRQEAHDLALLVAAKAQAPDADFAALAREYSDGPSSVDGGDLGTFPATRMLKAFVDAVLSLEVNEISDPVETQFGYHVILRQPVMKASVKHVLVAYTGSERAAPSITRTKEEALARCNEALERVRNGEAFEDIAREYSDGPTSIKGGDLGEFPRGIMAAAFDDATFACEIGKVTEVVETPFGYHIIYRYK